jgi:hypothetical protein
MLRKSVTDSAIIIEDAGRVASGSAGRSLCFLRAPIPNEASLFGDPWPPHIWMTSHPMTIMVANESGLSSRESLDLAHQGLDHQRLVYIGACKTDAVMVGRAQL